MACRYGEGNTAPLAAGPRGGSDAHAASARSASRPAAARRCGRVTEPRARVPGSRPGPPSDLLRLGEVPVLRTGLAVAPAPALPLLRLLVTLAHREPPTWYEPTAGRRRGGPRADAG